MRCPYCRNTKTKVVDSRSVNDGGAIRRRRHCLACGSRFTTFERMEKAQIAVVKRDGTREPYDREKLASGMYKACNKRNVGEEVIERNVDEIEAAIWNRNEKEISASEIGDMVMERLLLLDEMAYLRFASVYKRFRDVQEFQDELGALMTDGEEKAPGTGEIERSKS